MAYDLPKGETRPQTIARMVHEYPWREPTIRDRFSDDEGYWAMWILIERRLWSDHGINCDRAQAALKRAETAGLVEVRKGKKNRADSWMVRPANNDDSPEEGTDD